MKTKRMRFWLLGAILASSAQAEVTVRFERPDHYADLGLSGGSTPTIQADLMKQSIDEPCRKVICSSNII